MKHNWAGAWKPGVVPGVTSPRTGRETAMRLPIKLAIAVSTASLTLGAVPTRIPTGVASFTVPLSGQEEVNFAHPDGGTGDPSASGWVKLSVDPASRRVCYDFRLSGAPNTMMAHIHEGAPLRNGPPIIILFTGTGTSLAGCAPSTRGQLSEIVANPSQYYVSLDTTQFPDGALRGQIVELTT